MLEIVKKASYPYASLAQLIDNHVGTVNQKKDRHLKKAVGTQYGSNSPQCPVGQNIEVCPGLYTFLKKTTYQRHL